jgi:parallel beta-helix repeat protein
MSLFTKSSGIKLLIVVLSIVPLITFLIWPAIFTLASQATIEQSEQSEETAQEIVSSEVEVTNEQESVLNSDNQEQPPEESAAEDSNMVENTEQSEQSEETAQESVLNDGDPSEENSEVGVEILENGSLRTFKNINVGEVYKYPVDQRVQIEFTKFDESVDAPEFSFDQKTVEVDDRKVDGFEIKSNMRNGYFQYNLTLPNPTHSANIEVKYSENGNDFKEIEDKNVVSGLVKLEGLDHFTIFVVISPNPVNSDCSGAGVGVVGTDECYNTIQEAVDSAVGGETIQVFAGNYNETIIVDKPLQLQAEPGVILDGNGQTGSGISVRSSNVLIDGFEIINTPNDGITVGYENTPPGNLQNIIIRNNTIRNTNPAPHGFGIYVGYEFEGYGDGTISEPLDYSGLIIENNEVYDTNNATLVLQSIASSGDPIQVTGNNFHDAEASGIWIDGVRNLNIQDNQINENITGIFISSFGDGWYVEDGLYGAQNITVTGNTITNNDQDGISVYAGWASTFDFSGNNQIFDNANGINNTLSTSISAIENFWGDDSGPSGVGEGSGDTVSDGVNYCPWLDADGNPVDDCLLIAPEQIGYNSSADIDAGNRPAQLACGTNDDPVYTNHNQIAVLWDWDDTETVKYQRQYSVNNGPWTGNEVYTEQNTNYRNLSTAAGVEGKYGSRVRAFVDANNNNQVDIGELTSNWSNECYIIFDRTPPEVPEMVSITNQSGKMNLMCSDDTEAYTGGTEAADRDITITWEPSSETDIDFYYYGIKDNPYFQQVDHRVDDDGNLEVYEVSTGGRTYGFDGTHFYFEGAMNNNTDRNPFWYTVIAVDEAGNESAFDNEINDETDKSALPYTCGNVILGQDPEPQEPTGSLKIKKLVCEEGVTFAQNEIRPDNQGNITVDGQTIAFDDINNETIEGCQIATNEDYNFSIFYQPEVDSGAGEPNPWNETAEPFSYTDTYNLNTDVNGDILLEDVPVAGRYAVYETIDENTQLPDEEVLNFACFRDGDGDGAQEGVNNTQNFGEYATLRNTNETNTGHCIAINTLREEVEPQELAEIFWVKVAGETEVNERGGTGMAGVAEESRTWSATIRDSEGQEVFQLDNHGTLDSTNSYTREIYDGNEETMPACDQAEEGEVCYDRAVVAPGDYQLEENQQDGYELVYGRCHNGLTNSLIDSFGYKSGEEGFPVSANGDSEREFGQFSIEAEEQVYCVLFNEPVSSDITVCKEDAQGNRLSGWEMNLGGQLLAERTFTDSEVQNDQGFQIEELPAGDYRIEVSGTYQYGNSQMIADAGYSYRPNGIPEGCDCWFNNDFTTYAPGTLEVQIDGQAIDWGEYNDGHVYETTYTLNNPQQLRFNITDNSYGDNRTSTQENPLTVRVYSIEQSQVTQEDEENEENDGCTTFEDVPFGDYSLTETIQENWQVVTDPTNDGLISVEEDGETTYTFVNEYVEPQEPLGNIRIKKLVCDETLFNQEVRNNNQTDIRPDENGNVIIDGQTLGFDDIDNETIEGCQVATEPYYFDFHYRYERGDELYGNLNQYDEIESIDNFEVIGENVLEDIPSAGRYWIWEIDPESTDVPSSTLDEEILDFACYSTPNNETLGNAMGNAIIPDNGTGHCLAFNKVETVEPQEPTGSLKIKKLVCEEGVTFAQNEIRPDNQGNITVDGQTIAFDDINNETIEGCQIATNEDYNFSIFYQPEVDSGAGEPNPWNETAEPFSYTDTYNLNTDVNGDILLEDVPVAGRYAVYETIDENTQLPDEEVLNFACFRDGDGDGAQEGVNNTQNFGEYATLRNTNETNTGHCIAINTLREEVEPQEPLVADLTVCKENEDGMRMGGWEMQLDRVLVETIEVGAANVLDNNYQSQVLENGQNYIIEVTGTYSAGDEITADAQYSVRNPNTEWTDIVQNYEIHGEALLDLQVKSQSETLFTSPTWGEYNEDHQYEVTYTGQGEALDLRINDILISGQDASGNNNGSLIVNIYRAETTQTTRVTQIGDPNDGCTTFENLPFGEYNLREVQWEGWEVVTNPIGGVTEELTVSVDENTSNEQFIFVNKQVELPNEPVEPEPVDPEPGETPENENCDVDCSESNYIKEYHRYIKKIDSLLRTGGRD